MSSLFRFFPARYLHTLMVTALPPMMLAGCAGMQTGVSDSAREAQSITVFIYPAEGRVSDGQTVQVNLTSPVAGQERNHDNND